MDNKRFNIALIISIFFHLWITTTFLFPFIMKENQICEENPTLTTRMTFFNLDSFAQPVTERRDNPLSSYGKITDNVPVGDLAVGKKKTLLENIQEEIDQRIEDSLPIEVGITEQEEDVEIKSKEMIKEEKMIEPGKEKKVSPEKENPESVQPVKESKKGHSKTQNNKKLRSSNEKEANEIIIAENIKLSEEEEEIDLFSSVGLDNNLMNESNLSEKKEFPLDLTQSDFLDDRIIPPGIFSFYSPDYPEHLRKREIEGLVQLKVLVDKEGKAIQVEIEQTSGYQAFDQAAMESVCRWQFKPAQFGKRMRESWVFIPVVFQLE